MDSSIILAAVVGQFDPYLGPQTTLRMERPGSEIDLGLVWLMKYLLGDQTLTDDPEMTRMAKTLHVAPAEIVRSTLWNWKHVTFPEKNYSVIAVLFTDDETESNVIVAFVADLQRHGARMTACAPTIASVILTAMLNRRRRENTQPEDGVIDSFFLAHIAQASHLKEAVYVADHLVAGGITVGTSRRQSPCPAACARVRASALVNYAQDPEVYAALVHTMLSATSIVVMGKDHGQVHAWLHAAAFLLPGYRRHLGVLVGRAAMPVPTLSLQGVVITSWSDEEDVATNCPSRVLAAVRLWETGAVVIDADHRQVLLGSALELNQQGQPDLDKTLRNPKALFFHIHNKLNKLSLELRDKERTAQNPYARTEKMEAWLIAMRAELDMLAGRCAHMEGDVDDEFPTMTSTDRLLIRAALADPADKKRAGDNVHGLTYADGFLKL